MDTTNNYFSGFAATRARLAMIAATFVAAIGFAAPASATLTGVTLGAPSVTLTAGTGGSVTYLVTVAKDTNNNLSAAALSLSWTGTTPAGVTTSFSTNPVSWVFSSGNRTSTLTINTTAATPAAARNFTVRAQRTTVATDFKTVAGTLTVQTGGLPVAPTIAFGAAPAAVYLGGNFTISATTNSNGALTYNYVSGPCAQSNGATFSSTGAGVCVVQANTAATSIYLAGSAQQSVTIAQASPTITFGAAPLAQFPGPNFTASATTNSSGALSYGYVSGPCTLVSATSGTFTPTGVGSCAVQASTAANTNFTAGSQQLQITITAPATNLYAIAGTAALPGASVPVWGYTSTNANVLQPGGPTLVVNQGETVTVTLHNQLTEATGLLFQGQAMVPDLTGVAPGETKTYAFVAGQPGTYLYEAALLPNAQHQVAMGLYGALIVRPTASAARAYADAATAFDDESVLVLSEIDTALNCSGNPDYGCPALAGSASPAAFDMRNFAPKYFLINGKVYPDTTPIPSAAGHKVLLRYVNAGVQHHSMAVLGLRQNFVAKDGSPLPTLTHNVAAETLAAGQTGDAIATVPATAAAGSKFAVYDGSLKLHNDGDGSTFGGMLTFVHVSGAGGGPDTAGPATTNVAYAAGTLTATVSDAATGNATIAAARYYLDSTAGTATAMTASDGTFNAITEAVQATVTLPAGAHTLYVQGRDNLGNWGSFGAVAVNGGDTVGPVTSALVLAPNPATGAVDVVLTGTANDTTTGGSNIAEAEYQIDGGTALAMTVSPAGAKIASLSATIPAATVTALSNGPHTISVRSRDSATTANWGSPVTATLNVNKDSGPITSIVAATRNPNNGTLPLSATQPVVRVTATVSCATTCVNVGGAEGFIDTVGGNGTGFPFVPTDGTWNGITETVYADIPLSSIAALSSGNHTIYVHGKEAVGIWGATSSVILVIDRTPPTVSLTPAVNTVGVGAGVALNVAAADTGGAGLLAGGQYWIDGSATPPASPTVFTGTTISTGGLTAGTHTVYVRVQDAAGNWSSIASATVYVVQAVNDAVSFSADGNTNQNADFNAASGVLANDLPATGTTARIVSAPVRTGGTGTALPVILCTGGLGTAATPAVGGNTICTNGAFRVRFQGVNGTNAQQIAAKRGTYRFTYTETLNGVTSNASVTITVN
ncbi:MAG: multicopper oxidase domain-containing protein [Acidobacteriota bacterium]